MFEPSRLGKLLTSSALASVLGLAVMSSAVVAEAENETAESVELDFSLMFDEIKITAQKRSESIQDVGIAVTAFSGRQIQALGLTSSVDVIGLSPGVSMAGDIGGQRALFAIRGVVQNDFADHAEAPVAVYVDEGYLASTQAQTFGLFDVDRVEVLRGPQGTLFGRNATGGLVHAITKKPTKETEGYVNATYGRYNQVKLESAFGGPISDVVSGRLSAMYNTHDEILKNVYSGADAQGVTGTPGGGQDGYNDDTIAIRGQLQFDFSVNTQLWLAANFADTNKSEGPYQQTATVAVLDAEGRHIDTVYSRDVAAGCEALSAETGACIDLFADNDSDGVRPVVGGDLFGYIDPDGSGNLTAKDFAFTDENDISSYGFAGKLTHNFEKSTLTAISDYKHFDRSVGLDSDQSPTPFALYHSLGEIDQFSQEVRLDGSNDKFKWVTGAYYLYVDAKVTQGLAYPENSPFLAAIGLPGMPFEDNTTGHLTTHSYSAFGQVDYALNNQWTLVAGLRGGFEDKNYTQKIGEYVNADDRLVELETSTGYVPRADFHDTTSTFLWSGKLQLEFSPDESSLYYAGINRGVKAGSFNAKLFDGVTLSDEEIPYDEEVLVSYEAGFKKSFADGKTRLNGAVFYYDYKDYQAFTWTNNSGFVSNVDADYKGFELELTTTPTKNLNLLATVAYIDADVKDVTIAPGLTKDVKPPYTPKWQLSGVARYSWDAFEGSMAAQTSVSYQSSFYSNLRNFTAHKFDGYAKVDVGLTWDAYAEDWSVSAMVHNVFDNRYQVIGFDVSSFGGYSQESYARPRWWSLTVGYKF
ncbi:MAG: TonB-dependent receptor [Alphaproteobacteria bacterium]|nr:TonB-dependent receptor [Alphaproteobacteria bacterium]